MDEARVRAFLPGVPKIDLRVEGAHDVGRVVPQVAEDPVVEIDDGRQIVVDQWPDVSHGGPSLSGSQSDRRSLRWNGSFRDRGNPARCGFQTPFQGRG